VSFKLSSGAERKGKTMRPSRATIAMESLAIRSSAKNVLVIDVGGTSVKIPGQTEHRSFRSGPTLTPDRMVEGVKKLAADWTYDVASIGYPGSVLGGQPIAEPHNLGRGWEDSISRVRSAVP
jgi:polyphosphate glucokinase